MHDVNLPPNGVFRFPHPLAAEQTPIKFDSAAQPWMVGKVRIFAHPYCAVTDADGRFEIENAPAGRYRFVYWHEVSGFKGKAAGRFGDPIQIVADGSGRMSLPPTAFDVTK